MSSLTVPVLRWSGLSLFLAAFLSVGLLFLPVRANAQEAGGLDLTAEELNELGEAAGPVKELRPQKDKNVFLIFDVSGSMKGFKMWSRAREAAGNILRYGCRVGDDVGIITFGAGYDSLIKKLGSGEDKSAILEKIPADVRDGAGTNIRRPHYEALKAISERPGRPSYIIVFTDSYNDEPKPDDPSYADYLKYYTPGGQLMKYPKTSQNREYERLLRELVVSGKVKQFGIGVNFSDDGRPIERLPQGAASPVVLPTTAPESTTVSKPEEKPSPLLGIVLGAVGLAAIGGLVAFLSSPKPVPLRINNGPKEAKDFQVRNNQPVRIGGEGAKFAPDAFPIPELKAPVAVIRPGRGGMVVAPPTPAKVENGASGAVGAIGNENLKIRVLLNGLPLETETPAHYGDELRIAITPANGGVAKEYRLKLNDPKNI